MCSRDGLLLLVLPESEEGSGGDLSDLESDTGQITDGVAGTTETGNEYLVVLVNETHTTITGDKGSNSLVVLFELDSNALSNSRVRLLGLDGDFLNDDSGSVRSSTEGFLPAGGLVSFFVTFIGPSKQD